MLTIDENVKSEIGLLNKKKPTEISRFPKLFAEGEGFKPPIPERGIPDFESSAIDHSANLPICQIYHSPHLD